MRHECQQLSTTHLEGVSGRKYEVADGGRGGVGSLGHFLDLAAAAAQALCQLLTGVLCLPHKLGEQLQDKGTPGMLAPTEGAGWRRIGACCH